MKDIRQVLDNLVKTTESFDKSKVPSDLLSNLNKWRWGSYGWVSPASLIFTATWRKHFYPNEDCCKIWAKDESNNPIEGGYSIRSEDESITIPVLAKYDLCSGFCSPNSGMQGSRAIEKMRSLKRLNTDFNTSQRTVFDLKLFALILNQINDLNSEQALEALKYQIMIAKSIREKRYKTNAALQKAPSKDFKLLQFLQTTADPELTKCIVAACFDVILSKNNIVIEGVTDYKTAADARAQKPGDLSLIKDDKTIIAIEVKDKTQTIDWNNIDRAKKIINANPELINFIFVLENRKATVSNVVQEMVASDQFQSGPCFKITFLSLHDLYLLALATASENKIAAKTGYYLSIAPAVKPETKKSWLTLAR
jgi:hypothetical protein